MVKNISEGSLAQHGCHDILVKAIEKNEHGGWVSIQLDKVSTWDNTLDYIQVI